jgi:3-polyprenyl-4-hydroxybenzoate decarboxylase
MNYDSLREFITRLESEGELVRIAEPVSPILEIAEITDRVSKSPDGGKALLFENVEGSAMPVLINAFGSWRRIQMALGVSNLEKIAREVERFIKIAPPATLVDKAKLLPMLLQASNFPPKTISAKQASCQEVVMTGDAVDLGRIPILQCWPNDAGRFITYPIVINRSLDQSIRNESQPTHGSGRSYRRGPCILLRRVRSPALRYRRVSTGWIHPQKSGTAGEMQNGQPRSSGACRNRTGGIHRSRRDAP